MAMLHRQWWVGLPAGVLAVAWSFTDLWPFNSTARPLSAYPNPSIAQLILTDRIVLGFVRLGIVAVVVYIVVSIPALIVSGRWAKAFPTVAGPVGADTAREAQATQDTVQELKEQVGEVTTERDEALALVDDDGYPSEERGTGEEHDDTSERAKDTQG
jgi:hypothetical protein